MKKTVNVQEVEGDGLMALLGEEVILFCVNYIYVGKLAGVNETCVLLEEPKIVYETGAFTDADWKDAQSLPGRNHYVQRELIESFGPVK